MAATWADYNSGKTTTKTSRSWGAYNTQSVNLEQEAKTNYFKSVAPKGIDSSLYSQLKVPPS